MYYILAISIKECSLMEIFAVIILKRLHFFTNDT